MQASPPTDTTPAGPAPAMGTRSRASSESSSRHAATPIEPASNRKTMIAVGVVVVAVMVLASYVWVGSLRSSKPLPPDVAAVVAAAAQPVPHAVPPRASRPAPAEPSTAEPSTPAAEPSTPAAEPSAVELLTPAESPSAPAVAPPVPSAAPTLAATLESRERELALLRNALANERAARARAERSPSRSTVTAVLRDGVVVRDASGNDRVVGVGQKVP